MNNELHLSAIAPVLRSFSGEGLAKAEASAKADASVAKFLFSNKNT